MSAEELRSQGNEKYKGKDYDGAISLYTQSIELDPNSDNAALCLSNRSAAYQAKKMWQAAAADAEKCISLKPDFVKGYTRLANAQKKRGMLAEAIKALEDGLEKHPGNDELGKALEQYTALQKRFKASSGKGNDGKLEELMLEALKSKSNEAMELEKKLQMQGRQLQRVTADIKRDDRQSKLNMLTVKQLDELPAETKAYRSVGKMYLAQTMDEVKEGLQEDTVALEERKTQQMRKKEYLELQLKNSRNEMEDIYKALQKK